MEINFIPHPFHLDEARVVVDIDDLVAILYKGDGIIKLTNITIIDPNDNIAAIYENECVKISQFFIDTVKKSGRRYFTLSDM